MSTWTTEHVLSLAPDSSSAKSGRELAQARKWVSFAGGENALWGECQGSGKLPYQTQIDLSGPTFKCTCPSRKFPCKHGLGLLLMYAESPASFKDSEPPVWVKEWLEGRSKRAQAKAEKTAEPKEVDEAAQAKRLAAREKKVRAGLDELSLWLRDLVRGGLAQAPGKPYGFWEGMAARLVDAQAPGLARMVRQLGDQVSGERWAERLLERLGRIHLAVEGYKRLGELSPPTQADIRTALGFSLSQEEVLAQEGLQDRWRVVGQATVIEDNLRVRRTWLWGENSSRYALLLDFVFGKQPFTQAWGFSDLWEGELVFYPSAYPLRAVAKAGQLSQEAGSMVYPAQDFAGLMEAYSQALSQNPWLERLPATLTATLEPFGSTHTWTLRAPGGEQIRLERKFGFQQSLLSIGGGGALDIFGEWDGQSFFPLSAFSPRENLVFNLTHQESA